MVLTSNEETDEGVTQLVKVRNGHCKQFTKPYPCCSSKGCWECPANNFIQGLLETYKCFECFYLVQRVFSTIIDLQLRKTEIWEARGTPECQQ